MKILSILALVALLCVSLAPAQIQSFVAPGTYNVKLTLTSGTPQQITTSHVLITSFSVQMLHTATAGLGYVCIVFPGVTPASKCSGTGQLSFELPSATATSPGGQLGWPQAPTTSFDASTVWVDGDANSPVAVVFNVK